jgi:rod shape-determining protein MreD
MMRTASPSSRLRSQDEQVQAWRAASQRLVPAAVTFALIVATTAPIFVSVPVMPDLGLLAVIVWASFQPRLMPPWLAFGIGAIADLVTGTPLGVDATLLPLVVVFVRLVDARFTTHRYAFDWLFASAVIVGAAVIEWRLLAFAGVVGPMTPLLIRAATTILAYPAVVALAARVERRLAAR